MFAGRLELTSPVTTKLFAVVPYRINHPSSAGLTSMHGLTTTPQRSIQTESIRAAKPKLHYFDLLWICCTTNLHSWTDFILMTFDLHNNIGLFSFVYKQWRLLCRLCGFCDPFSTDSTFFSMDNHVKLSNVCLSAALFSVNNGLCVCVCFISCVLQCVFFLDQELIPDPISLYSVLRSRTKGHTDKRPHLPIYTPFELNDEWPFVRW